MTEFPHYRDNLLRYASITRQEAVERGLTRDCVKVVNHVAYHARTGLCWSVRPTNERPESQ